MCPSGVMSLHGLLTFYINEIWVLECDHYYVYLQIIKRTSIESDSEDEAGRFYL
jgi:hypothetical protein